MSAVAVGKISSFGNSQRDFCLQIWQMLLDSRSGAFPFTTATTPSGSANEGVTVPLISSFGMSDQQYAAEIWRMLLDSRNGTVPLVTTSV